MFDSLKWLRTAAGWLRWITKINTLSFNRFHNGQND